MSATVAARPRIFVVEDEAVVAMDAAMRLEALGYEVVGQAATGEEALEKAAAARPDLVLMDIRLRGGLDGIEAARLLRERHQIPVVYLTAYADSATLERAKLAEPLGFVLKPFAERELHAVVQMALYKRAMEQELRESRGWLEATLRSLSNGVVATDEAGRVVLMNPAAEAMTGRLRAGCLGSALASVLELVDEGTRLRKRLDGDAAGEGLVLSASGAELPVDVHVSAFHEGSGASGTLFVLTDLSERRREEERRRHAQKLETVGRLAGGIAHDFNNLLTTVIGYSDLLLSRIEAGDALHEDVREIRRAGERAASLTSQLLAFSRKQLLAPHVLGLDRLVEGVTRMLRRLIGEHIELVTVHGASVGHVKADAAQLEQVLVNLVLNARDAMPDGGVLTIETRAVDVSEADTQGRDGLRPGAYAALLVQDTGVGMESEVLAHAFEPFFTTKERGKGTGLGLSTIYGFVKQSGGYVLCDSAPGRGTLFTILLPRVAEAESEETERLPLDVVPGQGVVLVVEDEDAVRRLARRVLEARGYTVLDARDADDADQVVDGRIVHVDLLVTDVVMPGTDGPHTAQRLLGRFPGMKVLFISGYTEGVIARHGVLEPGTTLLQKPFTPDALAREVRRVLGR